MTSPDVAIHVLAVSGSLRSASSNTALLRALARLAKEPVRVTLYDGLADLPPFNPDHDEASSVPAPVRRWRDALGAAHALVISTPEYAHGVPGVLKNALDWAVSTTVLSEKPIAIVRPSPRAEWAVASLRETLTVMGGRLVPDACVTLDFRSNALGVDAVANDSAAAAVLAAALQTLAAAI